MTTRRDRRARRIMRPCPLRPADAPEDVLEWHEAPCPECHAGTQERHRWLRDRVREAGAVGDGDPSAPLPLP